MRKMATQSKITKTEIGRPESITTEDLSRRYRELKYFLESQWGRIGFELRRVRKPDKVLSILRLVPRIEQWAPFRDQPAACLLEHGEIEIEKSELDLLSHRYPRPWLLAEPLIGGCNRDYTPPSRARSMCILRTSSVCSKFRSRLQYRCD